MKGLRGLLRDFWLDFRELSAPQTVVLVSALLALMLAVSCPAVYSQEYEVAFNPPPAEAAAAGVTHRASSTEVVTATSATVDKPTGTVEDDFLVAVMHGNVANETNGPSDGTSWTLFAQSVSGTSSWSVWYRVATSSEPATYTFARDDAGSDDFILTVSAFDNVDENFPFDPNFSVVTPTGTTIDSTSIDVRTANNKVLAILGIGSGATVSTPPASYTQFVEEDGGAVGTAVYGIDQAAAGATGTVSWVISASATCKGLLMALRPAPASPIVSQISAAATGANVDNAGGNAWGTPDTIDISDGTRSTVTVSGTNATDYLRASEFSSFSVPGGATINGILVIVERSRAGGTTGEVVDVSLQLVDGTGTAVGDLKGYTTTNWPTTDTLQLYGDIGDDWGTALTSSDLNDTDFGVRITVSGAAGGANRQGRIDQVRMVVYYTP